MAKLHIEAPENSQNILSTVTINAPLEKVFEAYTKQELFTQWFMRGNEVIVDKFDAVDGGAWKIGEKAEDGKVYDFGGTFHEVAENERIVWTFEFMGMPERGHVSIERSDFVKINDTTTEVKAVSTFFSVKDRDGMIASGMEDGFRQSVEALGRLVEAKQNKHN